MIVRVLFLAETVTLTERVTLSVRVTVSAIKQKKLIVIMHL